METRPVEAERQPGGPAARPPWAGRVVAVASTVAMGALMVACGTTPGPETAPTAATRDVLPGSAFNRVFPADEAAAGGYGLTFTQEKPGFALATLTRGGADLADLAVSDAVGDAAVHADFKNYPDSINGFPMIEKGSTQSAVLVADRFQVKVIGRSPEFSASDRKEWLRKFDLMGLARLAPPPPAP